MRRALRMSLGVALLLVSACLEVPAPAGDGDAGGRIRGDVLHLDFDDTVDPLADEAQAERAFEVVGQVSFVSGPPGHGTAIALEDGGSLVVSDDLALLRPPAVTIEAWIRPTELTTCHAIVSDFDDGAAPTYVDLSVEIDGAGEPLIFYTSGGALESMAALDAEVAAEAWHHVAWIWDDRTAFIYRDGELRHTQAHAASDVQSARAWRIGARADGNCSFLGAIDEIKVFGHARMEDQIAASMDDRPE